jgi:hypothetical protein
MAGTSQPDRSHWPHGGDGGRFVVTLGPYDHQAGDTTGYKIVGMYKAPFDFKVKEAYLYMKEGGFTAGANALMKILDDSGSVQTIVAERTVDTSDDTGVPMTLTVADEGPILTGGVLQLCLDSGDASGVMEGFRVDLHCVPVYS